MSHKLAMRYLQGLVSNPRLGKNHRLPARALERLNDQSVTAVSKVVLGLLDAGSPLTPEVLIHNLTDVIGEESADAFVTNSLTNRVPSAQTRELHNVLLDQYVTEVSSEKLIWLQQNIKKPGAIDEAQEFFRNMKAMQPTKHVSLGKQTAQAMELSLNGAKSLVRYGFPYLDHHLGGQTRGEITLIAGRPSHGKTTFAMQLILNQIRAGHKVVIFSLEMPVARLLQKMLCNRSNIEFTKIRQGMMSIEEKERMTDVAEALVKDFSENLLIYDDVYGLNEMESIIAKQKPDVVMLDFVQLIASDGSGPRAEITDCVKRFKRMAKEYDMAPMILSQLNRNIENREDPKPRNSDLAEAGSLEQLAGTILHIWYEHIMDNDKPKGRVEIIATKTRYGELKTFPMGFDGRYSRYFQLGQPVAQSDLEDQIMEEGGGNGQEEGEVQEAN